MKESPYPLEQSLGLQYYSTNNTGIGGTMRQCPQDFKVDEIPIEFSSEGPYLIVKLQKTSWEHQHAIREISKRLSISSKRIGWAGTKDRNSVSTQYISLYHITEQKLSKVSIKDINLEYITNHQFALKLGDLIGNKFEIYIRNCSEKENKLEDQTSKITDDIRNFGIPNYYGIQRFGSLKPITHLVGKFILLKDYESAVNLYIGEAFPYESDTIKRIRTDFVQSGNTKQALYDLPTYLSYERIMLDVLSRYPDNYGLALQTLPPKLLSMFVAAYQSWLFNMALSSRFRSGISLNDIVEGDNLLFLNGRADHVTTKNIPTALQHMKRGRCDVGAWIPGSTSIASSQLGQLEQTMNSLMDSDNISTQSFKDASEFVKTKFEGTYRKIRLNVDISYKIINNNDVFLSFTLPPGHYATTVCREYMQEKPELMV
ncbi:MAG TPA: tRNA pseudouridine(13) synthase TruD [Methanocorpusculum sp.]|nr:tRNA pseudouridine(13) synthase TruD [Methanocorpusculum sp.]